MLPPPGPPDPIAQILAALAAQRGMGAPSPNPQMAQMGQAAFGPPPAGPGLQALAGGFGRPTPTAGLSRQAITALGQSVLDSARPPVGVRRAKGTNMGAGPSPHPLTAAEKRSIVAPSRPRQPFGPPPGVPSNQLAELLATILGPGGGSPSRIY
jgi:hypothetical protein